MPGRRYYQTAAKQYRYGFNGKEEDDEISGDGNNLDFGARIYDTRIGKWLSVDSYSDKYPNVSPYNFAINSPLQYKDANGNWLTDKDGNIIYTTAKITYERGNGKMYEVQVYYFYTNDGQKVEAGRYLFKTDLKNVEWDDVKNWPKGMVNDKLRVDMPSDSRENSNCHGNALKLRCGDKLDLYIPGKDWSNDKDNVSHIYKNKAEFTPVNAEDVKPGDVLLFEDGDGNIQHVATVTKVKQNGTVKLRSKDDRKPVRYKQKIRKIMKNENYKVLGGYYRHNENVNTGASSFQGFPGHIWTDEQMKQILDKLKEDKNSNSNSTEKKKD